jgi:hypothetical protein
LNGDLDIQKASEPTDIIWENRHYLPITRNLRRVIVYSVILIALSISAFIIYKCSSYGNYLKNKYPTSPTNCKSEIQIASNHG